MQKTSLATRALLVGLASLGVGMGLAIAQPVLGAGMLATGASRICDIDFPDSDSYHLCVATNLGKKPVDIEVELVDPQAGFALASLACAAVAPGKSCQVTSEFLNPTQCIISTSGSPKRITGGMTTVDVPDCKNVNLSLLGNSRALVFLPAR